MPRGFLRPDTVYRLRIGGAYTDNGSKMGNFNPRGRRAGTFSQTLSVRTAGQGAPLPLRVRRTRVSAMTISRLSVPMPAFLPSVNQIGFDSYDWIASTIARTRHRLLLWVIGATRSASGHERVQPRSAFAFPLAGRYQGSAVILDSPKVSLQFSFGPVPLRSFSLRGQLGPDLRFAPTANLYAETVCATVPNYGAELTFTGICNPKGVLAASGTFLSSAYHGTANVRPAGVRAGRVTVSRPTASAAGVARVRLTGRRLPSIRHHVAAILLTDARTDEPVTLDYQADTSLAATRRGGIDGVRLAIPRGTRLPRHLRAYVIVDSFPLSESLV